MIRRPPRSTLSSSSAASDVYKRQLLGLLLRTDEQHAPATGGKIAHEVVRGVDLAERTLEVDDVDAVAFGEDVRLHLRVPAPGLMSEVDTGFEQSLHRY